MIVCPNYELVYLDIPKTASKSLDHVFRKHFRGENIRRKDPEIPGWKYKHCRIIPDYAKNYTKIASVRNPYDKIVSHYFYNKKRGYRTNPKPTFPTFEEFVDECLDKLHNNPIDSLNGNIYGFFPCSKYLEVTGYDYIIRTEHIQEDFDKIPLPLSGITIPKMNTNSKRPRWNDIKTKELNEKIIEWACDDFELFGYEKDVI